MNATSYTNIATPWTTAASYSAMSRTKVTDAALLVTRHSEIAPRLRDQQRWDAAIREINKMRWLGKDWDGAGGKGPTSDVVDWAITLAERLRAKEITPPSRVAPGVTGSVLMEWQEGGVYYELEVPRPFAAELLTALPGQPPQWEEVTWDDPTLTKPRRVPRFEDEDRSLTSRLVALQA